MIDLEVSAGTSSPTVDPSVHTILVGHSMGGIVAADTLLAILGDVPVSGGARLPFPHIAGILAFDTPYLGLAPSVFANSADANLKTASAAFTQLSSLASGLFATRAASQGAAALREDTPRSPKSPKSPSPKEEEEEAPTPPWQRWGKVAALGGAAAALAGGAAAAYMKRDEITQGFGWVSSHLEFVGTLTKSDELNSRISRAAGVDGVGFANFFTSLGDKRGSPLFDGKERTFCTVPPSSSLLRRHWHRAVNTRADDEVGAHTGMFHAKTNPAYYELAETARNLITEWVSRDEWLEREVGVGTMTRPGSFQPSFSSRSTERVAREQIREKSARDGRPSIRDERYRSRDERLSNRNERPSIGGERRSSRDEMPSIRGERQNSRDERLESSRKRSKDAVMIDLAENPWV